MHVTVRAMHRSFPFPGARPRFAPDRVVDVEHIKLDLTLDVPRKKVSGSCTTTLTPILDGVRHVELDAVDLEILAVTLDGKPLRHTHDGAKLRVDLGKPRKAGHKLDVVVKYRATPRRGLYFVGPDEACPTRPLQVWSQGQDEDSRHWFPCFDAPHEKATSEVVVTVPEKFFALSNGTLVSTRASAARKTRTFHWRLDVPHSCYLVTLAAGELVEQRDDWNGVAVTYYAEPGREADVRRTLGRTPEMLELFSKKFGVRYPYEKYAQVFVADFIFGGMENTTATTLTDGQILDERAALDYDAESLVAHELAHQWFGDLITCRDWGQAWLNEGFATYSEYIWSEHAHGADEAALHVADFAAGYFGEDADRYRRAIATNVYDEPIDLFDRHLYEKGALVLHMLRRELGEASFWKALTHYLEKHKYSSVETRDLVRAIEAATGRNLDWFFDQWVLKAGHPELDVSLSWDESAKVARVIVRQTQKVVGETPLFRLPTQVRFRVGAADVDFALEVKDPHQAFAFALAAAPTQAIFDPGKHLLAKVKTEKARPLWLAELAGATVAADRSAAAAALAAHATGEVTAALARAVDKDAFWGVSAAAASALAELKSPSARDALIKALGRARHLKTRRAVVRALGQFRGDELAAAALEPLVTAGDKSCFVEAEACLALGKTRSPRAAAALRLAATRDSFMDVVRSHAWKGLAAARDDAALPLLLDGSRYGQPSFGRRAAIQALASLTAGRRDREARDVRERLEELLADPDFRVQMATVEGLATLGDPAAGPALARAADTALDGRMKRRAKETLRDFSEARGQADAVRGLREDVDRLRRELASVRERVAVAEGRGRRPAK